MKILFVCSGGLSSDIAAKALKEEAKKNGIEIEVKAVGTTEFEDELKKDNYDAALVAPQVRHRFVDLKKQADQAKVPCALIEPRSYTPLGGPSLLAQVQNLKKN